MAINDETSNDWFLMLFLLWGGDGGGQDVSQMLPRHGRVYLGMHSPIDIVVSSADAKRTRTCKN